MICLQCKQKVKDFYAFKKSCQSYHQNIPDNESDIEIIDDANIPSTSPKNASLNNATLQTLINLNYKIYSHVQAIETRVDELGGIKQTDEETEDASVDYEDDDADGEAVLEEIKSYNPRLKVPMATKSTKQRKGGLKPRIMRQLRNGTTEKPPDFPENIYFTTVEEVIAFEHILHDNLEHKQYFKNFMSNSLALKHHDFRSFIRHSLDLLMTRQTQITFTFANLRNLNSIDLLLELSCEIYPEIEKEQTLSYLRKHVFNKRSYYGSRLTDECH